MEELNAQKPRSVRIRRLVLIVLALACVSLWALLPPAGTQKSDQSVPRIVPISSPYTNTAPGVAYVGDTVCARCHSEIAATYRLHPMGRSMTTAAEVMPDVSGKVFEANKIIYSIERRDGHVFHQEALRDESGRVIARNEGEVRYVLGSGKRGMSFLVERDGKLYQSPISWYAEGKRWDLPPGYRAANLHFTRPITVECLFCHSNRVETAADGESLVLHGLSIGCERCHGPGEQHAKRQELVDDRDPTIVNPAQLDTPALRDSVCEQCHLQGVERSTRPGRSFFDYRPGLPFDAFVLVSLTSPDPSQRRRAVGHVEHMRESRCYKESAGRLGCISCHDPHRLPDPSERVRYYRDRCLECHNERGCTFPRPARLERTAEDDCTACHMPRGPVTDIGHTTVTDHAIPRVTEVTR